MRVKLTVHLDVEEMSWIDNYGISEWTWPQIRQHIKDHAAFTLDCALADEDNGARVSREDMPE